MTSTQKAAGSISVNDAIENLGFGFLQCRIVVICGLIQAADAMEMLVLAILGPALVCQWRMEPQEIASLTTIVFVGMMIGAPSFGFLADRYGRRPMLILSASLVSYFGCLSAAAHTYAWLLVCRGAVGFGVGGLVTSVSALFSEFMPLAMRAKGMVLLLSFWTIGGLLECLLAYFIIARWGWRIWLVFSALPLTLAMIAFIWLPESPRYLILSGQKEKAKETLNQIARVNGKPAIEGELTVPAGPVANRGNVLQMFHSQYRLTTALLMLIWLACGFLYYGMTLVSTALPEQAYHCLQNRSRVATTTTSQLDKSCCEPLSDATYLALTISTLGEFIGIPVCFVLLEGIGRRPTLFITLLATALFYFFLDFCMPRPAQDALLLLTRGSAVSIFNAAYIYSAEIYPTAIRTVAMGTCSAMARIGAMVTPFVAQVLLPRKSVFGALLIYSIVALLVCMAVTLLPIETKGRPLLQTTLDGGNDQAVEEEKEKEAQELRETKSSPVAEYSTFKKSS